MFLKKFRDGFGRVVTAVSYVGLALLFAMVFIVAVDVILRKISNSTVSIKGSNELTMYFMVPVCSLGIPLLQYKHGHVWVNLFVNKFPYRFRCFWRAVITLIETAVILLLTIGGWDKINLFASRGTSSDILGMPKAIFAAVAFVAFLMYFILSLVDTIQLFVDGAKNEEPEPTEGGWSEDEVKGI